jgi:hypothetical protein
MTANVLLPPAFEDTGSDAWLRRGAVTYDGIFMYIISHLFAKLSPDGFHAVNGSNRYFSMARSAGG